MSEKRFGYGETDLFEWVEKNGEMISTKECVNKLNELSEEKEYFERKKEYFLNKWSVVHAKNIQLRQEIKELKKENERLRNQLERKTILLKIRTKHIDDRAKSFHELLNYLASFCYKSNIDGNYAKQDIINILNNWEIREYD